MAWILLCKMCKFSDTVCNSCGEMKFFLGDCLYWRSVYIVQCCDWLKTWHVTQQWLRVRSPCWQFSRVLSQCWVDLSRRSWQTGFTRCDTQKVHVPTNPPRVFRSVHAACCQHQFISDRVSTADNAVPRPSVRPSVCLYVSTLTFEPSDLWSWSFTCVWVMDIALIGLKVQIRGQGYRVRVSVRNVVGRTSILNRGQFSS